MACTSSARAILLEQIQRTRHKPKEEIVSYIRISEDKIAAFDSELATSFDSTRTVIQLLERERLTLAALRYLIAPIRTLPVELLGEIFLLAISEYAKWSSHIVMVLRISHVCTDWNHVANATPRLWAGHMHVDLARSGRAQDFYAEGLRSWLARSAPLSLPISLRCTDWPLMRINISPRISEEILRIAPRWRSLQLRASKPIPASFVRRLAESKLDDLEELELGAIEQDVFNLGDKAILHFNTAPRLRKLRMTLHSSSVKIVMPWAQLSELSLSCHSPDIALAILSQCPNLTTTSIRTTGWTIPPHTTAAVQNLPYLRTFLFTFAGSSGHFVPFFSNLLMPELEELSFNFGEVPGGIVQWTSDRFTAFQLRSPNITRLELTSSYLTAEDLKAALRHAPSLLHLKLTCCPHSFDDTVIKAMQYEAGIEPLVPRLHHFVFEETYERMFSQDVLADMIASRWWTDDEFSAGSASPAVSRWTLVHLGSDFTQDFVDAMEILQRKGLRLEFL
ncbi:F-box domain-containing protein [Favolaschia claudopus]|uniref:F-box domain-containing protein n=1 Tax=Favolaschia claudopus TaxID=2862362 RepID=A0AAW0D9M2_9AGAR